MGFTFVMSNVGRESRDLSSADPLVLAAVVGGGRKAQGASGVTAGHRARHPRVKAQSL